MKSGVGHRSRASDEQILDFCKLRAEGYSNADIGRRLGVSPQRVSTSTTQVFRADLEESGEPGSAVKRHYW